MRGPFGHYTISFVRNGDEGEFLVSSGAAKMTWRVEVCERANGGWRLAGLTQGTVEIWGDTYWFECHVTQPVRVDYSVAFSGPTMGMNSQKAEIVAIALTCDVISITRR
jgi:hypothetical protein